MHIEQTTTSTITDLWTGVVSQAEQASCLEEAAQALTAAVHQEFGDSVVIARVFFTVPFDNLPPGNQTFVQNLVEGAGAVAALKTATPVLSLIGTHGAEADWNDRRKSKGHVGIPLISSEVCRRHSHDFSIAQGTGRPAGVGSTVTTRASRKPWLARRDYFLWKMLRKPRIRRAERSSPPRTSSHSTA